MGWGTTFEDDSFTNSDGTDLDTHGDWTRVVAWSGTYMEIRDNRAVSEATSDESVTYRNDNTAGSADYAVGGDLYFVDKTKNSEPRLGLRGVISTVSAYLVSYTASDDRFNLEEMGGGSVEVRDWADASSYSGAGNSVELILVASGTSLKVYADGTEVCSYTDSTLTAAGLVFMSYLNDANSGEGQVWDRVRAGAWTPDASSIAAIAHHHRMLQGVG